MFLSLIYLFIYFYIHLCGVCACISHVEVRGHPVGVNVLFLPCGSWDQIQVIKLGGKCLSLLHRLHSLSECVPAVYFIMVS